MSMSKQDFIALADAIREHNHANDERNQFTMKQLYSLAELCRQQNSNFMRDRWLGYIAGENGKSGGRVKAA